MSSVTRTPSACASWIAAASSASPLIVVGCAESQSSVIRFSVMPTSFIAS
jgi:hypothetical protein